MPTYDYHCDACSHDWELFQQMTADPVKVCPKCKKRKARRLIGAGAGIVFKGGGFYETDYRSSSYKKGAEADKKAQTKASESSESKSKSETKSGAKSGGKNGSKSETKSATGDAKSKGGKRKGKD